MTLDQLPTSTLLFRKDSSLEILPDYSQTSVLQAIEPKAEDWEILESGTLPGSGRRYYWSRLSEPGDRVNDVLTAWTGQTIYGNAVVMPQDYHDN
jgi:hypothetical protein